jgi:hypothetical protein
MNAAPRTARLLRVGALLLILAAYLVLATYQLGLPGLHYDEAREAGLNALELLTGAPVTAFRGAALRAFGADLPLMVQDYIGAANVYLALPILALSGIGVPNLRALSVLLGAAALLLLERSVTEYVQLAWRARAPGPAAPAAAGLIAALLLALSPSFVFWSRQGIFVTNLTQPLCLLMIWLGLRWLRTRSAWALLGSAFAAGAALYAKLLAVWVVAAFTAVAAGWWLWQRRRGAGPPLGLGLLLGSALAFLLPLLPFFWFNVQTGGTAAALGGNLARSYYGVNNADVLPNLAVRLGQLATALRGDHLWYLGGLYGNALAPWLALAAVLGALLRDWRRMLGPLLVLALAVLASVFTISDLFVTHYALVQPLAAGVVGIAAGILLAPGRALLPYRARVAFVAAGVLLWVALDLTTTVRYHGALARSGGLGDHSDASYGLAYHLRYNGLGAPVALDWGMDATVRFLSQGTVTPIEVFGYASPQAPDPDFPARLATFLDNPDSVYLLRAPGHEVFAGRRAAWQAAAARHGLAPRLEATFAQRDGTPLFELWRLAPM